ncbi:NAD(P)/FAD-dependent oxidoreductase [Conexibacter sp. DBS9H8]|uniref:NAD(P)/FAD-dependent oxidoreductase n=1 Tax=Conexibacter sp. DBS9H8 TaxID=2937801 RepID=UPI0020101DAF|nr:FAD-dependent oxidoreductase [Conexibacter sp. DBS9H8]
MSAHARPHVVVLGSSFAGLTTARYIHQKAGDHVRLTVVDPNPYLIFVPNLPMEVFADHDPLVTMHMETVRFHDSDGTTFINAAATEIDLDNRRVTIVPTDRAGSAPESLAYDMLVIATGNRLAYDQIEGFAEHGDTVSSGHYGNKLRRKLFHDYKGGPVAIGSARFHQGLTGKPDWLPEAVAACEGPPLEIGLTMAHWLGQRGLGDAHKITLFTPGEKIAEDAGDAIVDQFLQIATEMGFGYANNTQDIKAITADGIEFANGTSLEAELKIVLPDWVPHAFLAGLPISDERGFVLTDLRMRNPLHPEVFAVGDAAALTVPKLGSLGHQQAEIVADQIALQSGAIPESKVGEAFHPAILCFGDMGGHKGFYIHSDTWYGGTTSVFNMGYAAYAMKMAFKEMYFRTGGKPVSWGMPFTEFTMDHGLSRI